MPGASGTAGAGGPRPTIRHVAALAGVGTKTVSRVVNGEPNVSEATIERVRTAIRRLDYQPNLNAANLKRANCRTLTLGFLVGNVADPFSAAIQRAIEERAWERNTVVFSASHEYDPEREQGIVRAFLDRRVDGLILAPAGSRLSYRAVEAAVHAPLVLLGTMPTSFDADRVTTDHASGAADAARHLLRSGHRRIAYCGAVSDGVNRKAAEERHRGFMEELGRAGIAAIDTPMIEDLKAAEAARKAVVRLIHMDPNPTAIFTASRAVTVGAIKALRENGVHDSIALVGFDDFPLADLVDPGVTVIAQDAERIGRVAAERLFAQIDRCSEEPGTHLIPATLIERGSGEIRSAKSWMPDI